MTSFMFPSGRMSYLPLVPSPLEASVLPMSNSKESIDSEQEIKGRETMKRSNDAIAAEENLHCQPIGTGSSTGNTSEAESRTLPFKKRRFKVSDNQGPMDGHESPTQTQLNHSIAGTNSLTSIVSRDRTKDSSSCASDEGSSTPPECALDKSTSNNDLAVLEAPGEGDKTFSSNSIVPTGCHGRTTRTDTFCQRKPCYKGSNYCKLHYQQYVVFRIRSDRPAVVSTQSSTMSDDKKQDDTVSRIDVPAPAPERPKKLKYHDKCFTTTSTATDLSRVVGLPLSEQGTLRCLATTSRGHPCAYVAVHSTKYCFMHADYDTNPPRRRRPREARKPTTIPIVQRGVDPLALVAVAPQIVSSLHHAETALRLTVSPSSVLSVDRNFRQGPSPSLFMPRLWGPAPRPAPTETSMVFLSQLAKKEWYGTQVAILAGPFMYRTGSVEKWGNGWVSVRIANVHGHEHQPDTEGQPRDVVGGGPPGTILHNRRAFELCLVQAGQNPVQQQQQQIGSRWPGSNGSLMVS